MLDNWRSHPITASEVLVDSWLQRLECAWKSDAYTGFRAVSEACYSFYKNSAKFMWERDFRDKFIGNIQAPKFEITINKAFEYVALFGPYLFWDYPSRKVTAHNPLNFGIGAFGDPSDPYVQQQYEQMQGQKEAEKQRRDARCQLMSSYLNYSQREQENGLALHARLAIQDALIKGRGVLVPRTYKHPGSSRTLTELRYESVDNLRIDPDCYDPLLKSATWVAIRHRETVRECERRFKLKPGTLANAGSGATHEAVVKFNNRDTNQIHKAEGKSNDLIVWYEIWSKCGVGGWKQQDHDSNLIKALDDVVGDHAYLCVAADVPWLLNAPPEAFHEAITDDEVEAMLGWPFPCFMDGRWPLAILDFYHDSESCWPVAPLSAALGQLICMNVLIAAFVEQAYENRKSIIAVAEEVAKDFESKLMGNESPVVVRIKEEVGKAVSDLVAFINRPGMNTDILEALQWVTESFNMATGMVPFMYGSEQKVSRSAQDIAAKQERTSIRPEKMAKDVAAWQTEAATLEKFLACLYVQGADIRELIGDDGAFLWDQLIYGEDPEKVVRELTCYVEATDVARPNRERDLTNLQTLAQQLFPIYQAYAEASTDWQPLNQFIKQTMEAMQQPSDGLELGNVQPQPDPAVQQEAEIAQQEAENKMAIEQQKAEVAQQKAEMDMAVKQQDLEIKRELGQMQLVQSVAQMQMDAAKAEQDMQIQREQSQQEMALSAAEGQQSLALNRVTGAAKIQGMREQNKAKIQMAKQKPKPSTSGKK